MNQNQENIQILELLSCPAFSVKDGIVVNVNSPAKDLLIQEGTAVLSMVLTGKEDYAQLAPGACLSLVIETEASQFCAYVLRHEDQDLFLLDQDYNDPTQMALSLASCSLRLPLDRIMAGSQFLRKKAEGMDPDAEKYLNEITKGAYQLLRLVANMSDMIPYSQTLYQDGMDIEAFLREVVEKAAVLLEARNVILEFSGSLSERNLMGNRERLERAVHNLILNASAFPFENEPLRVLVELKETDNRIFITVTDNGRGISDNVFSTLFSRYRRVPTGENVRYGMGLGLPLVRAVAAGHGGTVLVERLRPHGTRVTMTIQRIPYRKELVHSPWIPMDYASEFDHALVELSDVLPSDIYGKM